MKYKEWFIEHYIEDESSIEACVLIAAQLNLTVKDIYRGCKELMKVFDSKQSLINHVDLLLKMADNGINAEIAGKKLREAIVETRANSCRSKNIQFKNVSGVIKMLVDAKRPITKEYIKFYNKLAHEIK